MRIEIEITYQLQNKKNATVLMQIEQEIVTLGRAEEDVVIRDIKCSRRHALLTEKGSGRLVIYDLGSRNGTFVNGNKIMAKELKKGDVVRMGSTLIKIINFESVAKQFKGRILPSVTEYKEDEFNTHYITVEGA